MMGYERGITNHIKVPGSKNEWSATEFWSSISAKCSLTGSVIDYFNIAVWNGVNYGKKK